MDYGLVLYYNNCTDKEKARYEKIQYNAARLVTSTLKYTSKEKLFSELGWETMEKRAYILGICLFHKIVKGETRPLIKSLLPEYNTSNHHNLRNTKPLKPFPFKGVKYSKSFFPFFTKKYNDLNKKTRQLLTEDFKLEIKKLFKPPRLKHLNTGSKYGCSLMTRVRVGRSYLKAHSFSIGLETDNTCSCNNSTQETSLHYMFCTNYSEQRLVLYQRIEQIIPNIQKLPLKRQYEIFMYGYDVYNPEMTKTNRQIMIATQTYILKTKRFDNFS